LVASPQLPGRPPGHFYHKLMLERAAEGCSLRCRALAKKLQASRPGKRVHCVSWSPPVSPSPTKLTANLTQIWPESP